MLLKYRVSRFDMRLVTHWIGGRAVASLGPRAPVFNPAPGQAGARSALATAAEVDAPRCNAPQAPFAPGPMCRRRAARASCSAFRNSSIKT